MWKSLVKNDEHSLVQISPPELESNAYQDPIISSANNTSANSALGATHSPVVGNAQTFPLSASPHTTSGSLGIDEEGKTGTDNITLNELSVRSRALEVKTTSITSYVYQLIMNIANTIKELKQKYPDRPIILAGWGAAAAINCQVASMEAILTTNSSSGNSFINACICFGFPFFTLEGSRGEPDDSLLDCRTPCLFVVGQSASQCRIDDLEDTRERMRVETGLIVVGGGNIFQNKVTWRRWCIQIIFVYLLLK